jgi:tetratricopeptide (TPR) repeat protein
MTDSPDQATSDIHRYAVARLQLDAGNPAAAIQGAEALPAKGDVAAHALELRGIAAAHDGKLEPALEHFRKAIAMDAKVPSFHCNQGNALQDLGRLDRAISSYRRALRLCPNYLEAHNDLGTAYYQKGWLDEAIECYQSAIRINPRHGITHGNIATAYRRLGRLREARAHFYEELKCRIRDAIRVARGWVEGTGRRIAASNPNAGDLVALAMRLKNAGDLRMAEVLCDEALRLTPGNRDAAHVYLDLLSARGAIDEALSFAASVESVLANDAEFLCQLGRLNAAAGHESQAEAGYRRALELRRDLSGALCGLAQLKSMGGRPAEAIPLFQAAIRSDARSADAWAGLGTAQAGGGDLAAAESSLLRALELAPGRLDALKILAEIKHERNDLSAAESMCRRILELDRDNVPALIRLGKVLQDQSRVDDALACWKEAIQIDPGNWVAYNNIGALYMHFPDKRKSLALKYLEEGLQRKPDSPRLLMNCVRLHLDEEDLEEAQKWAMRAVQSAPNDPDVMAMIGALEYYAGERERAITSLRRVIELNPAFAQAHSNLGHILLESGNLDEAWAEYEWRKKTEDFRRIHEQVRLPAWAGDAPKGQSLLIYPEQGLGDEMMFASCLPDLLRAGNDCTLICALKLEALFRRSFPTARVLGAAVPDIPAKVASLSPKPDYKLAIGSLPMYYRKSLSAFPQHAGYLKADPEKVARWKSRLDDLGPGLKVGISWKGGLPWTEAHSRTVGLERFLPILKGEGLKCVSLQYTDCREDLDTLRSSHGIVLPHWQEAIDDYDETAALVSALDVVVTVCTAVVHLAGGLGKPVIVMAPFKPTWRYAMMEGGMPWYPSVRVFRQPIRGDWAPVLERTVAELALMKASRT